MAPIIPDNAKPVFLSYARSDVNVCKQLKSALEQAGITCWLDTEAIGLGDKWLAALPEALAKARAMVILWSPAAEKSAYMEREFHAADALGLRIIPVLIEGQDLPFHLKDRNALFLGDNWEAGIGRLIRCLKGTLVQRQAELDWLHTLQAQLHDLYTPLPLKTCNAANSKLRCPVALISFKRCRAIATAS